MESLKTKFTKKLAGFLNNVSKRLEPVPKLPQQNILDDTVAELLTSCDVGDRDVKKLTRLVNEKIEKQGYAPVTWGKVKQSPAWQPFDFRRANTFGGRTIEQLTERPTKLVSLIELFLLAKGNNSDATTRRFGQQLCDFARYMPQDIGDITLTEINEFLAIKRSHVKPQSLNTYISGLKSFYSWLGEYGYPDIARHIGTERALPPMQRVLTTEEYQKVCSAASDDELDCFLFLCHTGLRVAEFCSLGKDNIRDNCVVVNGKGRRNRSIPLNKIALEVIERNPNFEMVRGRNRRMVYSLCQKVARQAGIMPFHPHSCRHFFANTLFHQSVDMHTISLLLGHSSSSITELVYTHWSAEKLESTTAGLEALGGGKAVAANDNKTIKIHCKVG